MEKPLLSRKDFYVQTVSLSTARELVESFHYAKGCANTAVYRHGLFHVDNANECLGVALWMPPTKPAAIASYDGDWRRVLALSRLVLHPNVPKNGASFLIGESIKRIKADGKWECLVTYADTSQGHTGAIYKATNWEYVGMTNPEPLWVDETGKQVARKATHTRTNAEMRELGYEVKGKYSKHKYRMVLK